MVDENAQKDQFTTTLNWRISNYQILLLQSVTPLLRQELHRAIKMHRRAIDDIKLREDDQYLEELDILHGGIQAHWNKVFGDMVSHVRLMKNIGRFEKFVSEKLLEDYAGKPYTFKDFEAQQAVLVEWHDDAVKGDSREVENDDSHESTPGESGSQHSDSDDDEYLLEIYNTDLVYPLQETMFILEAVENRPRMNKEERHRQASNVQHIIDQRDWPKLATTLVHDRLLALQLYAQNTLIPGLFGYDNKSAVLRGIDQTQSKYFSSLSNSATYTISKYALELSAEKNLSGLEKSTAPAQGSREGTPGPSWRNRARSLYNTFSEALQAGRAVPTLRSLARASHPRESFDEKDPLLASEKAQ